MARNLTTTIESKIQERYATEPIILLKVEWPDSSVAYYSDKDLVIETVEADGLITQFSPVSSSGKSGGTGNYSSVSVTLFDEDSAFKALMDQYGLAGSNVTVYQYYQGTALADLVVLLHGLLRQPSWDEGSREFRFNVEVIFEEQEVGYKAELDDFTGFNNSVAGKAWPLCFGTVLEVPTIRIKKYGNSAPTINDFSSADAKCYVEYVVENGQYIFPTDTSLQVKIGGILCEGSFVNQVVNVGDGFGIKTWIIPVFNVSSRNLPHNTSVAIADREQFDSDSDNASVLWLENNEDLVGQYCIVNHGTAGWIVNYCERQTGKKCFFRRPWAGAGSDLVLDSSNTISETAPVVRESWSATYIADSNDYAARRTTPAPRWEIEEFRDGNEVIRGRYTVRKGAEVIYELPGQNDLYLCNLIPSSEIIDVWAWRNYGNERIYVPVPSSYYTKHLSYAVDGKSVTAIEFPTPLINREKESWDPDSVYVSLRSSVPPNAASIIAWVINNYTDLTVDTASFEAVRPKVDDFWMCFCLTDTTDAVRLIEDLAWQARCALINDSGTIKIQFLPEEPTSQLEIDESWTASKTLTLSSTELEDVRTVLEAEWLKAYSGRNVDKRSFVYRNNESVYGTLEREVDMFAYNMEYCVEACLEFWGYRESNLWRLIALRTAFNALALQPYDCIDVSVDTFSTNTIKAIAASVQQDTGDDYIEINAELASKVDDADVGNQPEQDNDYWPGNPTTPDIKDPAAGRGEIDYIPPIPDEPGSSNSGGGTGGPSKDLFLIFEQVPGSVERGVNFALTLKIVNSDGSLFSTGRSFALQLQSSDASDVMNIVSGNFSGGIWNSQVQQITGGSGNDVAEIVATAEDAKAVSSSQITITDTLLATLVWTVPSTVGRDTNFSVSITGGSAGLVLNISLNSADAQDVLVDDTGTPITQITLDGSGNYSASNWQVQGGNGADFGTLIANDGTLVYEEAVSSIFNITGISTGRVENQLVTLSQVMRHQNEDLVIAFTSNELLPFTSFGLSVDYVDNDGAQIDYTGTAILKAYDAAAGEYMTWKQGGPVAVNYGDQLEISFVDGNWFDDNLELDWEGFWDEFVQFECYIELGYTLADILVEPVALARLNMVVPPAANRGIAFDLEVQATNADGSPNTGYSPSDNLAIQLTNADGEIITPGFIPKTGWVDGYYKINVTVTGGTEPKLLTMALNDAAQGLSGTTAIVLDSTEYTRSLTSWGALEGTYGVQPVGYWDWVPDYDASASGYWDQVIANARSLYLADSASAVSGSYASGYWESADKYDYVSMDAALGSRIGYFDLTAADQANVISGSLRMLYRSLEVRYYVDGGCDDQYTYYPKGSVLIRFSTDPYTMDTGLDIITGNTIDKTLFYSVTELNGYHYAASGKTESDIFFKTSIEVPITEDLLDYIRTVGSTRIYCTVYISSPDEQYSTRYTGGDTGYFSCPQKGVFQECEIFDMKLFY